MCLVWLAIKPGWAGLGRAGCVEEARVPARLLLGGPRGCIPASALAPLPSSPHPPPPPRAPLLTLPCPCPSLLPPACLPASPAVTIRLLDPPLHEFLPHEGTPELEALCDTLATEMKGRSGQHMNAVRILKNKIHGLQESNPMLGLRGCRLGIRHPGETRALRLRLLLPAPELLASDGRTAACCCQARLRACHAACWRP